MQALAASCEELRARTGNPPLGWALKSGMSALCGQIFTYTEFSFKTHLFLHGIFTKQITGVCPFS